jgi:hypothetical protein
MPWFNVDDGFAFHRKTVRVGNAAIGLWVRAGSWCAKELTDGFVPDHMVATMGTPTQAAKLIAAGLWLKVDGGYQFHEWAERNRSKTEVLEDRAYNARKAALYRDPKLLEAVRLRDSGRCRYCGSLVDWGNRRGRNGGTYDHVEPDGPNTLSNLVVACRSCNSRKGGRSPAEAGMPLLGVGSMGDLSAPAGQGSAYQVRTSPEPERNQNGTRSEQDPLLSTPLPSTTNPPSEGAPRTRSARSDRGTRIPDDFTVTPEMVTWARQRRPDVDGRLETEKFVNYWHAKTGRDATKKDWAATWRNWILGAKATPNFQAPGRTNGTGSKRVDKALGFLAANDPLRETLGLTYEPTDLRVIEGGKTA